MNQKSSSNKKGKFVPWIKNIDLDCNYKSNNENESSAWLDVNNKTNG